MSPSTRFTSPAFAPSLPIRSSLIHISLPNFFLCQFPPPLLNSQTPNRRRPTIVNIETPPKATPEKASSTTNDDAQASVPSDASLPVASGTVPARESVQQDILWTLGWVGLALATTVGVYATRGAERGLEFLTAYIVEYSLSVDNLFVFLLIFGYFKVERKAQLRVLNWGIWGAMVMRGVMVVLGAELTSRFSIVTVGFGLLLLFSAAKLILDGEGEEEEDLENNKIVKFARGLLPFGEHYDGVKFWTDNGKGVNIATPLLLVLICIELSDVVFALDSVPAVLGVSNDIFVVYISNLLAIVGLRNLFFVLSDAIGELRFLRQALAGVLGFVGGKMIAGVVGDVHVGVVQSLVVVVGLLGGGVGLSIAFPDKLKEKILEK